MYVKRVRSKSVPRKPNTNSKSNTRTKSKSSNASDTNNSKQQDKLHEQNSNDLINKEEREINCPNFAKLFKLEKSKRLKFIVCADTTDTHHQKIKYNWFDSAQQAKNIYDFFFPEKNCQLFWIEENKVKYLDPQSKIKQITSDKALIFPLKTTE